MSSGKVNALTLGRSGVLMVFGGGVLIVVALLATQARVQFGAAVVGAILCAVGSIVWAQSTLGSAQLTRFESVVSEIVERRLTQKMELVRASGELGLTEIHVDCTAFDYGPIISESRRLIVVLNDGRTWASVHRDRLRRRFTDSSKETTFILTHPDSPMIQVLARKGSKDVEIIKGRIHETVQLLDEIKEEGTSLSILGHYLFNPQAVVIGDDTAVVTPFFLARGGRTVPAFKYENVGKQCYFQDLVKDVERVRMDTRDISSIPRNAGIQDVLRMKPKAQ